MQMNNSVKVDWGGFPCTDRLHCLVGKEDVERQKELLQKVQAKDFMKRHKVKTCELRDENFKVIATYRWKDVKDIKL